MTDLPRISIIIPTRNRAHYLKRGLDKILESDYPDLEIIVMDGASTDDTVSLLRSYGNRITQWVSESDDGEYAALNKGIMLSTGDYIMHFTDDDVIIPSSLRSVGEFAASNSGIDIIFAQVNLWREINSIPVQYGGTKYLDPKALNPKRYFRSSTGPPTQGAFVSRRLYNCIGLYATDYFIGDYEFWARAIKFKATFALLPIVVADYHYTGQNGVIVNKDQIRRDHIRIASSYGTKIDKIIVWLTQTLIALLTDLAHTIGFHPLHWWVNMKVKKTKGA
jgi:glycosyltransferase involved in cell wall biosynthesis